MRPRSAPAFVAVAVLVAACSKVESQRPEGSPASTQPGSAAAQSDGPRQGGASASCGDLPNADQWKQWLKQAPANGGSAGGLFDGKMEWLSVVNRNGQICTTIAETDDPASAWPGSQAIAKAKAYTANAYSTDTLPLSTARLYTLTQTGHSLWGVGEPNPFNPQCVVGPDDADGTNGKICGGSVAFGGGVPLYKGKTKVGAIGASGDTACADHEMAKRIRHLAQLDPPMGTFADDIVYPSVDGASEFAHPLCDNTWRNGKKLGDETKVKTY